VLWPRIDQKTCAKAVVSAGMELVPIAMRLQGDALVTDVAAVRSKIAELGADNVLCVLSTTSCFAPRMPDAVAELVRLTAQLLTHPPSGLPLSALCWTSSLPSKDVVDCLKRRQKPGRRRGSSSHHLRDWLIEMAQDGPVAAWTDETAPRRQAKLCKETGVGHLVNNAYGVQARPITKLVTKAFRVGRVDAVIQSTDKNFMVRALPSPLSTS